MHNGPKEYAERIDPRPAETMTLRDRQRRQQRTRACIGCGNPIGPAHPICCSRLTWDDGSYEAPLCTHCCEHPWTPQDGRKGHERIDG